MATRLSHPLNAHARDVAHAVLRTTSTAVAAEAVRCAARCFALLPVGAPEAVRSALVQRLASDPDVIVAVQRACWSLAEPCSDPWTTEERCRAWAGEVARRRMTLLAEGWVEEALQERKHRHVRGCAPGQAEYVRDPARHIPISTRTRRHSPASTPADVRWVSLATVSTGAF